MKTLRLLALMVAGLMAAGMIFAADKKDKLDLTTRSVQGAVTDAAENLADGAVVQLKDTKTLQIRSFITKQDGVYYFHGLNPDLDYELKADHQGSSSGSKTLSAFDSRRKAVINLKLAEKK